MADCQPLITPEFLNAVTGADISDSSRVQWVITTVSTLIGEEQGACVDPDEASMKLKVVCAQYCSYVLSSGAGAGAAGNVRAEQIGDYRIEYQSSNKSDAFDLSVLRSMLQSIYGESTYTLTTTDERTYSPIPYFDLADPGYEEVAKGELFGLIGEDAYGDEDDISLNEAVGS